MQDCYCKLLQSSFLRYKSSGIIISQIERFQDKTTVQRNSLDTVLWSQVFSREMHLIAKHLHKIDRQSFTELTQGAKDFVCLSVPLCKVLVDRSQHHSHIEGCMQDMVYVESWAEKSHIARCSCIHLYDMLYTVKLGSRLKDAVKYHIILPIMAALSASRCVYNFFFFYYSRTSKACTFGSGKGDGLRNVTLRVAVRPRLKRYVWVTP